MSDDASRKTAREIRRIIADWRISGPDEPKRFLGGEIPGMLNLDALVDSIMHVVVGRTVTAGLAAPQPTGPAASNASTAPATADMPFPLAAIVRDGLGRTMLVSEINYHNHWLQPASYSLRGHPTLGWEPTAVAWIGHHDLTLIDQPSVFSWALLREAVRLDEESRVLRSAGI